MLFVVLLGLVCLAPAPARSPDLALDAAHLAPGDVLFRRAAPSDGLDARLRALVVQLGDGAIGDGALGDGHAPVHVAIYLGRGETAEAWGRTVEDARVDRRRLEDGARRGAAWRVLRHHDPAVRAALADVAGRWASGRMRFAWPLGATRAPRWNDAARRAAQAHVAAFDAVGGPPKRSAMFCSELAVAALQSAIARVRGGGVDALPAEARLDARSTPRAVLAAWRASGAFDEVGTLVVPAHTGSTSAPSASRRIGER